MKVVELSKGTDLIKVNPKAPTYLENRAKRHFERIAKLLIASEQLKRIHLPALEIFAENFSQWEWAVREIRRKNKKKPGSGYKQIYKSNAENISVELTIKRDAEKAIMQCFKQFGIDPRSEKELKVDNSGQLDMFNQLQQALSKTS